VFEGKIEIMSRILCLCLGVLLSSSVWAQKPAETEDEYEHTYEWRIQKEVINGVYIPANIPDVFAEFHKLIDKESKAKFKSLEEEEAVTKLHFSFGRWIIVNWGFYQGSRLSHELKKMGLHHPDDMARFLMTAYHRSLNQQPIKAKKIIKELADNREKQRIERLKQGTLIKEEKTPIKSGGSN
jgi:hypothetical protein